MVKSLRDIVHSKSPAQILAQTGSVLQAFDDQTKGKLGWVGKLFKGFGGVARALGATPGFAVDALEATQWADFAANIFKVATTPSYKERRDLKGEWFPGKPTKDEESLESRMQTYDNLISKVVGIDEAYSQTKTMAGATALVGGKGYSATEFMKHFDRFADYHEFTYKFNKRTRRSLSSEAGASLISDTLPNLVDGSDLFFRMLKSRW